VLIYISKSPHAEAVRPRPAAPFEAGEGVAGQRVRTAP
jgi:hypothetical protein